ncbi:translin-associated factor X-interacting protein 1 [Chanos chanos]|uniref:Translin-associated factor X-interacting protein 1 n=1 Tax=Chanos chanos TaxID=29144 RepID=A0A6J2ULL5_CHACN|nr:translin-associated factor X-interacting protein 1 [Chanos chanos]
MATTCKQTSRTQMFLGKEEHGGFSRFENEWKLICIEEFSGTATKPRFLERLEGYLERELRALDPQSPVVQELRLQAYREVFDHFIEALKTYKPLLSAIKSEYEITLAHQTEQIREIKPLRAQLVLVSERCEKRILDWNKQESEEIKTLKQECQHLQSVIEDMRERQRALDTQVCHLKKDLAAQYLKYREERDARKLLIVTMSNTAQGSEKQPDEQQEESVDPVKLKLALKVCREDLMKAQQELNLLQANYWDVVPRRDWENLERTHTQTLLKLETLQTDFDQMKMEYDTLLGVHQQITMQRDNLQAELKAFRETSTPRPQWDMCTDMLGTRKPWAELFDGQSSRRRLEILLAELNGEVSEQNEFFTGLGTSDDVPAHLRYKGQLKNLKLKKEDVVRLIKDVWREKTVEDEKRDNRSNLSEFLRRYLESHHGRQAGEWAYSLMDSIQHHLNNDLISLFHDILTGKVDESLYHGQNHMLSNLLKVLIQRDATENGTLTISEFSDALRTTFPLKGDQDIEELIKAAQSELGPSGGIAYQRLYTEDADGKQRNFLSLVKRQATTERHQYISQLRTQLESMGEVGISELRTAFETIDPTLDSATLNWNLSVAFSIPVAQLHLHSANLDTEVALQRLLVADVKREGPVAHND